MATKTISIDLDAYERLRAARRRPQESFSTVIKRAIWEPQERSCGALLGRLRSVPVLDEELLDRLDAAQRADAPPESRWQG